MKKIFALCFFMFASMNVFAIDPFTVQKVENVRVILDNGKVLFKPGPENCPSNCSCNWWRLSSAASETAVNRTLTLLLAAKTTNSTITIEKGACAAGDYPQARIINFGDLEAW